RVLFIGTRQDKGGRNDTDHEYWSHTIRAEAAILKMQNVRCEFVAAFKRSIMVRELETILKNIPERIGIICASGSILRMLKSLSETHPELIEGKDIDTVLFTHYASRDYFVGKPVWQVRWNMREMGQQAMTHLLSHIENGAFKTGIHKMPVELY
ncbi:MAG: hypothetical protein JNL74_02470, partial [Fibrobacteres bacterium]|nr:hypothetical protein [Fibrobacterota bacterium]